MKSFAIVAVLGLASAAGASERYPLFPDHHVPDEDALRSVERMAKACAYPEMSRIGPNPEDVARCNAAEKKVLAIGSRAAPAVMQKLDDAAVSYTAAGHLYDVLARVGGPDLVRPLVAALEIEDAHGIGNPRSYERGHLRHTLERITHVELKGTPAIQWRQWANAHRAQPTQTATADGPPAS